MIVENVDYCYEKKFLIEKGCTMKYLPLFNYRYFLIQQGKDPSFIEKEYQQRLNNYTSQKTSLFPLLTYKDGRQSGHYPIFFLPLPEIQNLADQLRRNSNTIKKLAANLPSVATKQFLSSLLLSEIVYTNDIEGVKTNRVEISTIIQEYNNQPKSQKGHVSSKRLGSTIKMYQFTQSERKLMIHSLSDFRKIYDSLLKGEITEDRQPNGKLFRDALPNNERLSIGNDKIVHRPPVTEDDIQAALTSLIEYMNNDEVPAIYKALVTHFFFENTHPFLDGNGRMGRYLLSSYLANQFDHFTGFSVATAIHHNVQEYYKVFKEADKAENRADLTFFIRSLLRILVDQQEHILTYLSQSVNDLYRAQKQIKKWISHHQQELVTAQVDNGHYLNVLYILAQSKLFSHQENLGVTDNEILESLKQEPNRQYTMTKTRAILDKLTGLGAIKLVSKRPKQHVIEILD